MRIAGTDGAATRHFCLSCSWGTPGESAEWVFAALTLLWVSPSWGHWEDGHQFCGLVHIVWYENR
jgi:hypothetical protein